MNDFDVHYFSRWPYDDALSWMSQAHQQVKKAPHKIVVGCGSHDEAVITAGKRYEYDHHHGTRDVLFRKLDRGGGLTAHEPGQIVLYPVMNLEQHKLAVKILVTALEKTMISFLHDVGLLAVCRPCGPGVFVDDEKIGFIGLRINEGISQHGIALNVKNDAHIFSHFAPCGNASLRVTSVCHHVSVDKPMSVYCELLVKHFAAALAREHES